MLRLSNQKLPNLVLQPIIVLFLIVLKKKIAHKRHEACNNLNAASMIVTEYKQSSYEVSNKRALMRG